MAPPPLHRTSSMRRLSIGSTTTTQPAAAAVDPTLTELQQAPPPPLETLMPVSGSGLSRHVRDMVLVLDRNEVVFVLGKFVVVQNLQSQELAFLSGQQTASATPSSRVKASESRVELGEITAMAVCGKRQYLSLCRAATSRSSSATVTIYNLKSLGSHRARGESNQRGTRQKTLRFETDRFSCTTLSSDGKLVCCQSTTATWTLVVWDWSRERQIAIADVHCKVTRVRFNIIDMAQLSTSGSNQLKLWTLSEYTLKPFASFKSGDELRAKHVTQYADHVWLPDDCLVALLEDGSVQLVVNGELLQTVQALPSGAKATCIVALSQGDGVIVAGEDGTLALVRLGVKMMRAGEKEMHLQRRMRLQDPDRILSLAVDIAATTLVCCTERLYGSYDLSNLSLLLGDDEVVVLNPLASTPFVSEMPQRLSAASRRPCFAVTCQLPTSSHAALVWQQLDAHECVIMHAFESPSASPLCMDLHPHGSEMLVAFASRVVVFSVLHDSLKVAYELPAKQATHVQYSPSGSHIALVVGSAPRALLVYRTSTRAHREPQLLGIYRDLQEASIHLLSWSLNDSSFFLADTVGEIRHYRLETQATGEIDECIALQGSTTIFNKNHTVVELVNVRCARDTHEYIAFAVEKCGRSLGKESTKGTSSTLRAWIDGNLSYDALVSVSGTLSSSSVVIPHDVTTLCAGRGRTLLAGTAAGVVVVLYWKPGRLRVDGQHRVYLRVDALRSIDLHTSSIAGLYYAPVTQRVLTASSSGVVLVCELQRENDSEQRRNAFDQDFEAITESSQSFVSVAQPDEVALYDRSAMELRKLKLLDIEGELQQAKMENEMLTKHLNEQKQLFHDRLTSELRRVQTKHEQEQHAMRSDWDVTAHKLSLERDQSINAVTSDAQRARDQYLAGMERAQRECERLRDELNMAKTQIQDLNYETEERESTLRSEFEATLRSTKEASDTMRSKLEGELDLTKKRLAEVLKQLDQDQLEQLSLLSTAMETEKARAADQMSNVQGKMAALHQEVKMLLSALNQKDHALEMLKATCKQSQDEMLDLEVQLEDEREAAEHTRREKQELASQLAEQKRVFEQLQRLNNVHRSQIELLQKNLMPKDREIEQMQQHLTALHRVNQEIVVDANLSERLRLESAAKAKQHAQEMEAAQKQLEIVRHSIVVLQDELGELVKQSAVQEKSALVQELTRIHKRLTRQLDVLQAKDERSEEVSAELHRQNRSLMKNKQHLRKQMELAHKERHKLVSALAYQNTTLMSELNAMRKQNKELERHAKRADASKGSNQTSIEPEITMTDEVDGRQVHARAVVPLPQYTARLRSNPGITRPRSAAPSLTSNRRPSSAMR
ncbi:hypothetical protein Poli38472_010645 [Pythium oligandrum]|uniref:Cilia- and flagella-associated protein 57 n=1 Tax=Pythium oligandrum TaxID=41045 RepID=A0A8K1C3N8_PYTOL|nr:hypothetical protein Poli38472_010645 [Pythium oligandrum]|eukprot:TMW55763.1 hypothetical protein Poli38472_010645 [Pythium oligandrum]